VDANVGHLPQPLLRLSVEVLVVEERSPVEEVLRHVADGPLDLALGPGVVGSAVSGLKAIRQVSARFPGLLLCLVIGSSGMVAAAGGTCLGS
jgi:hypothetical protein